MSGTFGDYIENGVLQHIFKSDFSLSGVYAALSTTTPTDAGGNVTEPVGNGYARVQITQNGTYWTQSSRQVVNDQDVDFPSASGGDWGTITHVCLYDSLSGGNFIGFTDLNSSKSVVDGNTVKLEAGDIVISWDATNGLSNYIVAEMLDHLFLGAAYSAPATLYMALCTALPADSATGSTISEASGTSYARVAITRDSGWTAPSGGALENEGVIQFPTPGGAWSTCTHWAICDASSAGNLICFAALSTSQTPGTDDDVQFADGALDLALT